MKKCLCTFLVLTTITCVSCTVVKNGDDTNNEFLIKDSRAITNEVLPWEKYNEKLYTGYDIDLTFWHTQYDNPIGIYESVTENMIDRALEVETRAGDIYVNNMGRYTEYTFVGLRIRAYSAQNSPEDNLIYELYTDRTDIYSYRGIHVGSTLEEIKTAYEGELPSEIVENGSIKYMDSEYWGSFGPYLEFYIEDDVVVAMRLMFTPYRNYNLDSNTSDE